jgi:ribosomal protein L28
MLRAIGNLLPQRSARVRSLYKGKAGKAIPNRAKRGLWHGRGIGSGNKVSEYKNKSRRKWLPNVQATRWWSDLLQRHVRITCTARAIKTIDKKGGFDSYMVNTSYKTMSPGGIGKGPDLRREMLAVLKERRAAGIADPVTLRPRTKFLIRDRLAVVRHATFRVSPERACFLFFV